jgi:hypothetical protein
MNKENKDYRHSFMNSGQALPTEKKGKIVF